MILEYDLYVGVVTPLFLSIREHQSESKSHILIEMLLVMIGLRNSRSIDIRMRDNKSQLDFLVLLLSIES